MKKILLCFIFIVLSSCGIYENVNNPQTISKPKEPGLFSKDKDKGISIRDLLLKPEEETSKFYVNAFLWRASLEIASVAPLISTDAFGGTIISDWYTDPNIKNKRIKITIFVKSRELISNGLSVKVLVQSKKKSDWSEITEDKDLSSKLEEIILAKARDLRVNSKK